MENIDLQPLCQLIRQQRWGAMATMRNGEPYCTMAAYVAHPNLSSLTLHLSTLAPHTQRLLKAPQASFAISDIDHGTDNPQTLARVSLNGQVHAIEVAHQDYAAHKQRYLERLPDAEMLFSFADFSLYEFSIEKIRYVGGFAMARNVSPQQLTNAAADY